MASYDYGKNGRSLVVRVKENRRNKEREIKTGKVIRWGKGGGVQMNAGRSRVTPTFWEG